MPEVLIQGREIGVFLAFSRFPASITRIEQDLRRRTLYPGELRRHIQRVFYRKKPGLSTKNNHIFSGFFRIIAHMKLKRVASMEPWVDPEIDLDDLIYAEEESGPSQR